MAQERNSDALESRFLRAGRICLLLITLLLLTDISACREKTSTSNSTEAQPSTPKVTTQTPAAPASPLSGKWSGKYYYQDGKSVAFSGTMQQQDDNLSGTFTEPRTTFGPMMGVIEFTLSGKLVNNDVNLLKVYNYDKSHRVNYSGIYYPKERSIRGNWNIDKTSGRFEMSLE